MADNPKLAAKGRRAQRLQAALRENLKRRKAQARDRAERCDNDNATAQPPFAPTRDKESAD